MSKGFITGTNEELIKAYKESRDESYLKDLIEANKGLINLLVSPYLTSIDIFAIYGANDGFKTWALYQFQKKYLREDHPRADYRKLYHVFRDIEMPLIDVCMDMELRGVEIREDYAKELSVKFNAEMAEKEKLCDEYVAKFDKFIEENPTLMRLTKGTKKINYNSPQQVACLFYDIFKLKSVSRKEPRGTGDKIVQQHRNKQDIQRQELLL